MCGRATHRWSNQQGMNRWITWTNNKYTSGPAPEEPGEPLRAPEEVCGGLHEAGQRGRPGEDREEEAEEQLPGCHEDAAEQRGRDQRLSQDDGPEAYPEGLADHRR